MADPRRRTQAASEIRPTLPHKSEESVHPYAVLTLPDPQALSSPPSFFMLEESANVRGTRVRAGPNSGHRLRLYGDGLLNEDRQTGSPEPKMRDVGAQHAA